MPQHGPRHHCAEDARLLAAPNRYLAGSTARSCLLEIADAVFISADVCEVVAQM
jgi:hypothetical protein